MVEGVNYNIESIYQGGYSSLDPDKSYGLNPFTGYHSNPGSLGLTTDPRTANVLQEITSKLNTGVKQMEIEGLSPEIFESMPDQHLQEVQKLADLTGLDVSLHGPVVDTTGISQQGFSELNREAVERKLKSVIERSTQLKKKGHGNILVNFHSAEGIPGTEWKIENGKKVPARLIVVNKETGKLAPLEYEKKYYPESEDISKGEIWTPEKRMNSLNKTEWDNSISQLIINKERMDELLQKSAPAINHMEELAEKGELDPKKIAQYPELARYAYQYKNAGVYLEDLYQNVHSLFSKAYEYGDENQRKHLTELSNQFKKQTEKDHSMIAQSNAMQNLMMEMKKRELAPKMYVPVEEFATEQSAKTYGNIAFHGYKKFKGGAPIVAIENPPAGFALSTGEDVKKLVEESRKQFIEQATLEGVDKSTAKTQAEKLIGSTLDVGHLNMLRKQGFEEKDIIKEAEQFKSTLKHVHLSDNFGLDHTEIPMGMGNVPFKEIMKKLGQKGYEAKKIIEAGNWYQHMRTIPLTESMEGVGAPMFASGGGPYWNQSGALYQGYYGGYGMFLPQGNYNTFGASFSQLPMELGGQKQGQGAGMSGRSME